MADFRIMPAQRHDLMPHSGTRYGFPIFDHPKGDPGHSGCYVASWDSEEKAKAAACCLGYLPNVVVPIGWYVPDESGEWNR